MAGIVDELASGKRFGQFASVGAVGAVVDLSISSTLTLAGLVAPAFAKVIGAEAAIVVMFLINDRWTFAEAGRTGRMPVVRRFLKSNLVRSGGLAVQFVVVVGLTGTGTSVYVGETDLWPVLTMPIAIGCSFLVNYVAESLFTWRVAS
ncbi:MAG: GtrA family protein [Halobacteriota archaeon]